MPHKHVAYIIYGLIASVFLFCGALVIFFAGYQFAIYQTAKNNTWFPHFDVPSSQLDNCGALTGPVDTSCCNLCNVAAKPVIYLYPSQTENINVRLQYPAGFLTSAPAYNAQSGWNVQATPSGSLTNSSDGKTYPYLYWEGNPLHLNFNMSQGFVVAGNQSKAFLLKELPELGLNTKETNDFMAYWLPKLQSNKYSLVHFAGNEYTDVAKLTITPKPNSLLRVFMVEKSIPKPINVTPQTFPHFQRSGFTAVEWGGMVVQ